MKDYETKSIRNLALVGHNGAGKTSFNEALLFNAGAVNKMGSTPSKNTVSDYDPEEQKRQMSISLTVNQCEYKKHKLNIIDAPGYEDFVAEKRSAIYVSENALLLIDATSGIGVGTENAWDYGVKTGTHNLCFINKLDKENTSFPPLVEQLNQTFGANFVPITIPVGEADSFRGVVNVLTQKAYIYDGGKVKEEEIPSEMKDKVEEIRTAIIEAAAETNEALMEKYFEEGTLTPEEISQGIEKGIRNNTFVPVFAGSASLNIGIREFMDFCLQCLPSPEGFSYKTSEEKEISTNEKDPFCAFVFKSTADPFAGQLSFFKVIRGSITGGDSVVNVAKERTEKVNHLSVAKGKEHQEVSRLNAGDIGVLTKAESVGFGDTLCDPSDAVQIKPIELPKPIYTVSMKCASRQDEEKLSGNLAKLIADDPTLSLKRDSELSQTLLSGMGEIQVEILVSRLKTRYSVNIDLHPPRVHYRETIEKTVEAQGKHKKQSGGHGQYGDVHIRFEPLPKGSGFEFVDAIVGGAIPSKFIPSVEKGLIESMQKGFLAGYPVVDIRATLYDGTFHNVDSSDLAFKIAASLSFKTAMGKANPILLEPIMKMEILVPEEYMGDVMGDLNTKRGKILGMDADENKKQKIRAEVPHAEVLRYPIELRSLARGRGSFTIEFSHYEKVPSHIQQQIVEETKKIQEEQND